MDRDRMALRAFRHLVAEAFGLEFPPSKQDEFLAALREGLKAHGVGTLAALFDRLEGEPPTGDAWQAVRLRLTVGETYFFRDRGQLNVIKDRVLTPLTRRRPGHVRLWSAGCSSGEEAYSLAFTALEVLAENQGWTLEVLGTDIHEVSLARARTGRYPEWSFRGMDLAQRERWFQRSGDQWLVRPELQAKVQFRHHNLAQDPFAPLAQGEGFDLILCRNVFIYLGAPTKELIVEGFLTTLKPSGALVLGHNELGPDLGRRFRIEPYADALLIRPGQPTPTPWPLVGSAALPTPPAPKALPAPISLPPPRMADPLEEARRALAAGESARALTLARKALDRSPRSPDAVRLVSQSLANLGRPQEALKLLEEVLDRGASAPSLHYLHSLLAAELGQEGVALRALEKVIRIDPNHVAAHMDRAHVLETLGRGPEARHDLEQALAVLEGHAGDGRLEGLESFQVAEVLQRCRDLLARSSAGAGP